MDGDKVSGIKGKLNELLESAQVVEKPKRSRRQPATAGNTIYVDGKGHAFGQVAGGDIHNHHYDKPPRGPKVTVTPGVGVISEEQKVALTRLRDEWILLHNSIRKNPLGYGAAWTRINKAAGATSYHLIQACNFTLAVSYIKKEMAKLRNMRSAPSKDVKWHNSRIGAIKARCKNQLGDEFAYKPYIKKNFKAESLADLATDELQKTYVYIMGKKLI